MQIYTQEQIDVALAYYQAVKGDQKTRVKKAAKLSGVKPEALQSWISSPKSAVSTTDPSSSRRSSFSASPGGETPTPDTGTISSRSPVEESSYTDRLASLYSDRSDPFLPSTGERPRPPAHLEDRYPPDFVPDPDLEAWVRAQYIEDGGPLHNADHWHLALASIGFVWTNVMNSRGGMMVAGSAQMPKGQGDKWAKARVEHQMRSWFGEVPDFLITLDSVYAGQADDRTFGALIDHELYHCSQAVDKDGCPKFSGAGMPVFSMRGHDVEEFVGVVRRWGAGPAAGATTGLVEAAQRSPLIADASVRLACGNCLRNT